MSIKKNSKLDSLKKEVKKFVYERDWEQFHSPKNLSMSLSIEAAELMEHFQWANTIEESVKILKDEHKKSEIEDEIADIAIYLIDFCNLYDVDLEKVVFKKIRKNEKKYPVQIVKGKSDKYTAYRKK